MTRLLLLQLSLFAVAAAADEDRLAPPAPVEPVEVAPLLTAGEQVSDGGQGTLSELVQAIIVDHLAAALGRGDQESATTLADAALGGLSGRRKDAVAFAAATLHAAEAPDRARQLLTDVGQGDGPLAPHASLLLAEAALDGGAPQAAVTACDVTRRRWPGTPQADLCDAITAAAAARLGQVDLAADAASAWDRRHPKEPLDEVVALRLAEHGLGDPRTAVDATAALQRLAVDFRSPVTRSVATELLTAAGADVPRDPVSQRAAIESLLDAGLTGEAWTTFTALSARDDLNPTTAAWVRDHRGTVAWRARAWDAVLEDVDAAWARTPTSDVAWRGYKAASRGGRFDDAAAWIEIGLARWGRSRPWRDAADPFAQVLLLGGHAEVAHTLLAPGASSRSATGRRRLLLLALSDLAADHVEEARDHLDALAATPNEQRTAALYWRARTWTATAATTAGAASEAAHHAASDDQAALLRLEPDGWYATLVRGAASTHAGRFATAAAPHAPVPIAPELPAPRVTLPHDAADPRPPAGYPAGPLYDPLRGRRLLADLAARHGARWPELEAVADLASVGLYDRSGPLMASWYDDVVRAARGRDPVAKALLRELDTDALVAVFGASRNHHDTARLTWARHRGQADPRDALASRQLQFPVAHGATVWDAAREADVDPWLVLALMRSESTYNTLAVSPVGARGPMQIMPRTGHLLAASLGVSRFQTSDSFEPETAVGLGVRYLGLLNRRFGGAWPLAVASYNAGPHNVGAWLAGAGGSADVPWLVELIPFRETRDYVRRVGGWYDLYTRLYDGEGVHVPARASGQDPGVVDF